MSIPVLNVQGQSLAETHERALVALYEHGARQNPQYDKPGDPPSLDCTTNATVLDPLAEPMIQESYAEAESDVRRKIADYDASR